MPVATKRACTGATLKRILAPSIRHNINRNSSLASAQYENADVVIVGGGPAGLALASALSGPVFSRHRMKVTLVEGGDLAKIKDWSPQPGVFSNRISSLTQVSRDFLSTIGAWVHVDEKRVCPVEAMQVWDGISDARISFVASALGLDSTRSMAYLTENLNLQRGLLRHLKKNDRVQLLQATRVNSITQDGIDRAGWPLVHLDNGRVLRARLLVGADGFNSPVRSYAHIPTFGWSYDSQAIVATMEHLPRGAFEAPNTTAYQRFLPTGPIAFLPLSSTISSLVWSTKPPLAKALLGCHSEVLVHMINAAFRLPVVSMRYLQDRILEAHASGTPMTQEAFQQEISWREKCHSIDPTSSLSSTVRLRGVPPVDAEAVPPLVTTLQAGSAASFPLRFNHAEAYLGEGSGGRTVLIGDAAHTIHPLAGQGLNLGLGDVECLARCLAMALERGGDVGSYTALSSYARERYLKNHVVMAAVDKLHKLYSTEASPIVWARSVGLEVLNELDTLKSAIMMSAGAQSGDGCGAQANGWGMVGYGLETAIGGARSVQAVGKAMMNAGVRSLLSAVRK